MCAQVCQGGQRWSLDSPNVDMKTISSLVSMFHLTRARSRLADISDAGHLATFIINTRPKELSIRRINLQIREKSLQRPQDLTLLNLWTITYSKATYTPH